MKEITIKVNGSIIPGYLFIGRAPKYSEQCSTTPHKPKWWKKDRYLAIISGMVPIIPPGNSGWDQIEIIFIYNDWSIGKITNENFRNELWCEICTTVWELLE